MFRRATGLSIAFLALFLFAPIAAHAQSAGDDLNTARSRHGALVTRAELGAILNEVAWKHRGEGFGLLAKSGGNVCPQPRTGKTVSCDWLVNSKTHRGGDVMRASTNDDGSPAPGQPTFNQDASFDGNGFVDPVEPEGGITEPPPPPPPGDFATKADLVELHTTLWNEVSSALRDVRGLRDRDVAEADAARRLLSSELSTLSARVATLEGKPSGGGNTGGGTPPPPAEQLEILREILRILKAAGARLGVQ